MNLEIQSIPAGGAEPAAWGGLHRALAYRGADDPRLGEGLLAIVDGGAKARLAYHLAPPMRGLEGTTGLVSHYESLDSGAGTALLKEACARLRGLGAGLVLGPMHGSTWMRYRLALPAAGPAEEGPPFIGEPQNPPRYAGEWLEAGFSEREPYASFAIKLSDPARSIREGERAAAALGAGLHPLEAGKLEAEIEGLYGEACEAFAGNLLYSPISRRAFADLYLPLKPLLDSRLAWMFKDAQGRVLGHALAWAEGPRVILKNLAVRPSHRGGRLGWRLIQLVHAEAARRGCAEVVHALTHMDNSSASISRVYGGDASVLRRYALYQRVLS